MSMASEIIESAQQPVEWPAVGGEYRHVGSLEGKIFMRVVAAIKPDAFGPRFIVENCHEGEEKGFSSHTMSASTIRTLTLPPDRSPVPKLRAQLERWEEFGRRIIRNPGDKGLAEMAKEILGCTD